MDGPPGFWKIFLKQCWLMVSSVVPVCLWGFFLAWAFYPNVFEISLSMSTSIPIVLLVWTAWSDYKWKQKDWVREQRTRAREEERKYTVMRLASESGFSRNFRAGFGGSKSPKHNGTIMFYAVKANGYSPEPCAGSSSRSSLTEIEVRSKSG